MPFTVPAFAQIRDDLLRDIKNLLPEADTRPDSDYFVRASSVASAVEGLYHHQAWIVRQIFPDTADREYLERHAQVRGLQRKPATSAGGQIRFSGTPGAALPPGIVAKLGELQYQTIQSGVIGADGKATLPAAATVAGTAGNAIAGALLELTSAPDGVAGQAVIVSMVGGMEEESDGELLARLLELIRRPPAGGNKYDYRRWALEVPGVAGAFVYPLRRGLGTVDVVITAAGGLPSTEVLAAVQAHIDDQRPVTARSSLVICPQEVWVDITVRARLYGISKEQAEERLQESLGTYFAPLAPGAMVIRSQIEGVISATAGIIDRELLTPAANLVPVVDSSMVQWVRLGTVTVVPL